MNRDLRTPEAELIRLAEAYMLAANFRLAEKYAMAILQREANSVQGNLLLARVLIGDGQVRKGAEYAKRAMELDPLNPAPVTYYGRALQSLGQIAEADELFRRSIELEPRQGFAYHALVNNHRVTEEERGLISKMEQLSRDGSLPLGDVVQLEYGLGKACEDLGQYEAAMQHFDTANRIEQALKKGGPPFEKERLRETTNSLVRMFNTSFFANNRAVATQSDLPIFVVGMMRSGTTLAEQILSSHPDVGGAGEQLFWPNSVAATQKLMRLRGGNPIFDPAGIQSLAASYLELLRTIAPGKERVVDKMNTNYQLLGLLHIVFPHARIIHMQRHPVDTCISIWATPLANGMELFGEKENIVCAYEQYLRVMAHWRTVLPRDRLMDVRYEDLISDRERVTREMVAFCGLTWDEACMRPEENKRLVRTPSIWQVRQPVYKTSVERWRNYEPWLGPFAKLLPGFET